MTKQDKEQALVTTLKSAIQKYDTLLLLIKLVHDEKNNAAVTTRRQLADYEKLETEMRRFYLEMGVPIKKALAYTQGMTADKAQDMQQPTTAKQGRKKT
jgi:hypothetical protein